MLKKSVKYIILGQGLAGSILASYLLERKETFVVINKEEKWSSSEVAAGVFNPLTGPRVVKSWLADDIFPISRSFFQRQEDILKKKLLNDFPILKVFGSQEQQTDVLAKATERYKDYLNVENDDLSFSGLIKAEYGTAEILKGGVVDVNTYRLSLRKELEKNDLYIEKQVSFDEIQIENGTVQIGGIQGQHLICTQGFHAKEDGFFDWLPFSLTKGEIITIEADLPQTHIINKGIFLLPKGGNCFLVGSSFELKYDKTPTSKGLNYLTKKLDEILNVSYKVVDHIAGIRPTVKDRRPYLGTHPKHSNVHIFNGLGAKGVTLGPYFGNEFLEYIENDKPLYKEVNINRYNTVYTDSLC